MNKAYTKIILTYLGLFFAFAPTLALADSQLRIEWRIGDKTEYRILNIEKNGQTLTVDTTQKQVILPTSGDCSRWDTSQLRKEWVTGMRINVTVSLPRIYLFIMAKRWSRQSIRLGLVVLMVKSTA